MTDSSAAPFEDLCDLAAERLGGAVVFANDEFFAAKENLLLAHPAEWKEGVYTERGKWMDGWETRRRRELGYDFCLVRLGAPGIIRGIVVDTAFFRGNFPESCSLEACAVEGNPSPAQLQAAAWTELVPRSGLVGHAKNRFVIASPTRATHLRLNIFPDGGVARLRVHGEVLPDPRIALRPGAEIDLAALENGALVTSCSDMFFGERGNLILPGRGTHMGDGWETKRRRGPGHDWSIVQLASAGTIHRVEVDTAHFKGNAPDRCVLEGLYGQEWREILPAQKLQPHTRHLFLDEVLAHEPVSQVRLSIYPDGGVSRLRLWGTLSEDGRRALGLRHLNALPDAEAGAALLRCCGSSRFATALAARRPFTDLAGLVASADEIWRALDPASDWREAFAAHPRIGQKTTVTKAADRWAQREQAGVDGAADETRAALAALNQTYEERFGHVFLICATGKSAVEMLAALEARLANDAAAELANAGEEQRKITALRLIKLVEGNR